MDVVCSTIKVEHNTISSASIVHLVQQHKRKGFRLQELVLHCLDVNPENVQKFVYSDTTRLVSTPTLMSVYQPISIQPMVHVFHSTATLLFLYNNQHQEKHNVTRKRVP